MDRGAWQAAVHKVAKNWIRLKWFSTHVCTYSCARAKGWNQWDLAGTCSWMGLAWEHHLLSSPYFSLESILQPWFHFLDDVLCVCPGINEPLNAFSGMKGWMSINLCWGTATVPPTPRVCHHAFPTPALVPLTIVTYSHMWLPSGLFRRQWGILRTYRETFQLNTSYRIPLPKVLGLSRFLSQALPGHIRVIRWREFPKTQPDVIEEYLEPSLNVSVDWQVRNDQLLMKMQRKPVRRRERRSEKSGMEADKCSQAMQTSLPVCAHPLTTEKGPEITGKSEVARV